MAAFSSIPILDFSQIATPFTKPAFLSDLRHAIINVGFFYLKNTSIPLDVQDAFVEKGIEVFRLPVDRKLEIEMVNSKHFLGYSRLGAEITALKSDYREQFDFATELPAPEPDEPVYRNLRGPNQWPDETAIPGFRRTVEIYLSHVDRLAETFKSLIAEALDIPADSLYRFFDTPQQHKLKLIEYPPPVSLESPENTVGETDGDIQGVGPHKDSGFLTYLLQGTPHTGLEVQNKSGAWIPAPPIPGTLVINIGRALEILTGGVCTATTHRVNLRRENFVDSDGNSLGPRFSFPVFQGVGLDLSSQQMSGAQQVQVPSRIAELARENGLVKSDAEATFNEMFRGHVGQGTFIARITSHQDVGRRWYPELLERALREQKEFGYV